MSATTRLRFLVPVLAATALILATAGGVLAKCGTDPGLCEGVTATFDPGGTLMAGGFETVGLWVLENEQPYAADRVQITFRNAANGTEVRVAARPGQPDGRWQASVELPVEGTWTTAALVQGPGFAGTIELDTMQVGPPSVAGTTSPASTPLAPVVPLVPWLLVGVALAIALGAAVTMTRRGAVTARG